MYSGEKSPSSINNNESSPWDALAATPEARDQILSSLSEESRGNYEATVSQINEDQAKDYKNEYAISHRHTPEEYENFRRNAMNQAIESEMSKLNEHDRSELDAIFAQIAEDEQKDYANPYAISHKHTREEYDQFRMDAIMNAMARTEQEARDRAAIEAADRQNIEDTERAQMTGGEAAGQEPANIDAINQGLGQETQPDQPEQEPTGSTDTVDQAMSEAYPGLANVWDDAAVKQARDEWVESQPGLKDLSEQDKAAVDNAIEQAAEQVSDQEIKETLGKAKKNRNFKRFLVRVLGVALAVGALAGFIAGVHNRQNNAPVENPAPIESVDQNAPVYDSYDEHAGLTSETQESEKGIHDGYDKKGMWLSENKGGHNRFAAGQEVAEACNNDEVEMIKYTAGNQSESMADYIANLPEELQPEGFKGLSIIETEQKLENLSDDEYESVKQQFNDTMDKAFTRHTTLNGKYHNSYMRLKDEAKGVTHDNMELVECTTTENNVEVNQFYWLDENGNEIGSMTVKIFYDENGDITGGCLQVVNPVESEKSHIYGGLTSIEESQDDDSGTGLEGTGGTGSEGTGDTGSEGTGETGSEGTDGTGSEGTDGTGLEGTGSEGTGSEGTGSEGTDIIESKDAQNLERIDQNILDDIANDIGTDAVTIDNEDTIPVNQETVTVAPDESDYEGTEATIVENEQAPAAEPVQETISEENNYSENRGGANADEYAPVQADSAGQTEATDNRTPNENLPGANDEGSSDILEELGINN